MEEKELMKWRDIFRALRPYYTGLFWPYFVISLFLTVAAGTTIAEPVIFGRIIDIVVASIADGAVSGAFRAAAPLFVLWVVIEVVGNALRDVARYSGYRLGHRVVYDRFMDFTVGRIFHWDPTRFGNIALGGLAKQVDRAAQRLWEVSARNIRDIFPMFISIIAFFIVGLFISPRMTLVMFTVLPVFVLVARVGNRWITQAQAQLDTAWDEYFTLFYDYVGQVSVIKSFAQEERARTTLRDHMRSVITRQRRVDILWAIFSFTMALLRFAARGTVLVFGIWWISQGLLTIGTLFTFIGMLSLLLDPLDQLFADVLQTVQEGRTAMSKLLPQLQEENAIVDPQTGFDFPAEPPEVKIDRVRFRYAETGKDALKEVSISVPAGTSLALVGHSGSGKSTLAKMLNRFLDPTSGHIYVEGIDLRNFRLATVRGGIGLVSQETQLFNTSILENVRFAKPSATKEEVIAVCKMAQANEFIQRLEKGYDTMVGERGVKLSGGERQRLAIARVLLADTPVLILDESTSALDSETETMLQVALRKAMRGRTTFVIAHRLSTVYMCDQIAVLDKGAVVQIGTHDELLREEDGLYERLWKLQSGGYLPE